MNELVEGKLILRAIEYTFERLNLILNSPK